MTHVDPAANATPWMRGSGTWAILFYDGSSEDTVPRFESLPLPRWVKRAVIDAREDPQVETWFGIRHFPSLAVVRDGALLAIEHECDEETCARVVATARGRHPGCFEC